MSIYDLTKGKNIDLNVDNITYNTLSPNAIQISSTLTGCINQQNMLINITKVGKVVFANIGITSLISNNTDAVINGTAIPLAYRPVGVLRAFPIPWIGASGVSITAYMTFNANGTIIISAAADGTGALDGTPGGAGVGWDTTELDFQWTTA
jgi:hypothetical protein